MINHCLGLNLGPHAIVNLGPMRSPMQAITGFLAAAVSAIGGKWNADRQVKMLRSLAEEVKDTERLERQKEKEEEPFYVRTRFTSSYTVFAC